MLIGLISDVHSSVVSLKAEVLELDELSENGLNDSEFNGVISINRQKYYQVRIFSSPANVPLATIS